jgi:hypothetical protein
MISAQIRANKRSRHLLKSPMKTGFYQRLQNRAKLLFIIRSQMLYPVELRAPLEEQLICEGRARRSNNAERWKNFPATCKIRNDLLTQGYGVDRAKSSTLRSTCLHRQALRAGIEHSGLLRPCITTQ